jgi:hypothetical protein
MLDQSFYRVNSRTSRGTNDPGNRFYRSIFEELRRQGGGQNLTIERYFGERRPAEHADLAREVVSRRPDVISAATDAIARAVQLNGDAGRAAHDLARITEQRRRVHTALTRI